VPPVHEIVGKGAAQFPCLHRWPALVHGQMLHHDARVPTNRSRSSGRPAERNYPSHYLQGYWENTAGWPSRAPCLLPVRHRWWGLHSTGHNQFAYAQRESWLQEISAFDSRYRPELPAHSIACRRRCVCPALKQVLRHSTEQSKMAVTVSSNFGTAKMSLSLRIPVPSNPSRNVLLNLFQMR
jgi:hypothetical protein